MLIGFCSPRRAPTSPFSVPGERPPVGGGAGLLGRRDGGGGARPRRRAAPSCAPRSTLFERADPNEPVFTGLLVKFYGGRRDERTEYALARPLRARGGRLSSRAEAGLRAAASGFGRRVSSRRRAVGPRRKRCRRRKRNDAGSAAELSRAARFALLCAPVALLLCCCCPRALFGRQQSPASRRRPAGRRALLLAGRLAAVRARRARHPRRASEHARAAQPALEGSGSIEGTVTSASPVAGLPGIEVCAFELAGLEADEYREREPDCVVVEEALGVYRIDGLARRKVRRRIPRPPAQRRDPVLGRQAAGRRIQPRTKWNPKRPRRASTRRWSRAGGIEGVLTGGGEPLAGVFACWAEPDREVLGCTGTGADGHYLITGLPSGNYELGFIVPHTPGLNYLTELRGDEVEAHGQPDELRRNRRTGSREGDPGPGHGGGRRRRSRGYPSHGVTTRRRSNPRSPRAMADTSSNGCQATSTGRILRHQRNVPAPVLRGKAERFEATPVAVVAGQPTTGIDAVLHTVAPEPPPSRPLPRSAPVKHSDHCRSLLSRPARVCCRTKSSLRPSPWAPACTSPGAPRPSRSRARPGRAKERSSCSARSCVATV